MTETVYSTGEVYTILSKLNQIGLRETYMIMYYSIANVVGSDDSIPYYTEKMHFDNYLDGW